MVISVIICTCNGGQRILQALKSIEEMSVPPGIQWELIVVDNNSSDDTREVINNFARHSKLDVRYLFEKRQGLSNARNKGLSEAKGNYVAFTDDDCIVDRDWLVFIINEFEADDTLGALGGQVQLFNESHKPVTIRTYKDRKVISSPYELLTFLPGCNMAFTRKAIDAVGDFDPEFGAGARYAAAEDTDFFYRVYKTGLKMIYSPDILIYHNHGRCTDAEVHALNRNYVIGRGALYCKYILMGDGAILKMAIRENYRRFVNLFKKTLKGKSIVQDIQYTYYLMIGAKSRLFRGLPDKNSQQTAAVKNPENKTF